MGDYLEVITEPLPPDGKILASGSDDKSIRLWDITSGKTISILRGHQKSVRSIAFSPNGQVLSSGSDDCTIKLWRLADNHNTATLHWGDNGFVLSVSFSPDGSTLASGHALNLSSGNAEIKLWDLLTGQNTTTIVDNKDFFIPSVAFSPDGRFLASGSLQGNSKLWETKTGRLIDILVLFGGPALAVAFSPDGQSVVSAGFPNLIYVTTLQAINPR